MSGNVYELASLYWQKEGNLIVCDQSNQRLLVVPLTFARTGCCATFKYVSEQVQSCFVERGTLCRQDSDLTPLGTDDEIYAGTAVFVREGRPLACGTARKVNRGCILNRCRS